MLYNNSINMNKDNLSTSDLENKIKNITETYNKNVDKLNEFQIGRAHV